MLIIYLQELIKKYYKAKLFAQFIVGGFVASFPLVISFVVTAMILPAFKPESVSSQFNFSKLSVFGDLFLKHRLQWLL